MTVHEGGYAEELLPRMISPFAAAAAAAVTHLTSPFSFLSNFLSSSLCVCVCVRVGKWLLFLFCFRSRLPIYDREEESLQKSLTGRQRQPEKSVERQLMK